MFLDESFLEFAVREALGAATDIVPVIDAVKTCQDATRNQMG